MATEPARAQASAAPFARSNRRLGSADSRRWSVWRVERKGPRGAEGDWGTPGQSWSFVVAAFPAEARTNSVSSHDGLPQRGAEERDDGEHGIGAGRRGLGRLSSRGGGGRRLPGRVSGRHTRQFRRSTAVDGVRPLVGHVQFDGQFGHSGLLSHPVHEVAPVVRDDRFVVLHAVAAMVASAAPTPVPFGSAA